MASPAQTSPSVLSIAIVLSLVAFAFVFRFIVHRSGRLYGPLSADAPAHHDQLVTLRTEWRAPAELAGRSTPRDVQFTRTAWTSFTLLGVLAVGLTILAATLYSSLLHEQQDSELVAREGIEVLGRVLAITEQHQRSETSYRVTYAYDLNDRHYSSSANVDHATYQRLTAGAALPVRYAPSKPEVSRIDGRDENPPWVALLLLFPAVMLGVLPMTVVRQRRLLMWGTAAPAIVTRVVRVKGGLAVRFQFLDPSGTIVTGNGSGPRQETLTPGQPITVLYDPGHPARSARYPMTMAKIAG